MMLVCTFFIVSPYKADAAVKTKELEENTNYQINLDGDKKKETFKYMKKNVDDAYVVKTELLHEMKPYKYELHDATIYFVKMFFVQ